jgi:hypothetical protein
MRRVLMISPHFPPDATAGAHRVRVLAPHLEAHGWRPTVLTVDPRDYEGTLDLELANALPAGLDVVRCRAWPAAWTRRAGVGDLGMRALVPLRRAAEALARSRAADVVFITTYPVYPAIIGPAIRKSQGLPFVLDLQDPWVGEWGLSVGGGPGGRPDPRSRASRALAVRLERYVVPRAAAITSVSSGLLAELTARYPVLATRPQATLPIGLDPRDVEWARTHPAPRPWDAPDDGRLHLWYTGTLLPLGFDTLRALLEALRALRAAQPALADRLRLHFLGTSNQARPDEPPRVTPIAHAMGVGDLVREHPTRVPFMDALRTQLGAGALLLLGTTEARYTASKLQVALATDRPLLAVFHEGSDVARTLGPLTARGVRLVTYGHDAPVDARVGAIRLVLEDWAASAPPPRTVSTIDDASSASGLAARLAALFDRVAPPAHA